MWLFGAKKKNERLLREEARMRKIEESQAVLLSAATTTADMAQHITSHLRKSLEDSIRQFDATARLISDALIICDENSQIKAFNPAAELMFGTPVSVIGMIPATHFFLLNDKEPNPKNLWKAIEDRSSNLVGRRMMGEKFQIDVTLTRLENQGGETSILILIRDLTSSLEDQRAIETHALRFQTLFNLSFDGILIIQGSTVVAANKSAGQIFGIDSDKLINTSSAFLPDTTPTKFPKEILVPKSDGTHLDLLFSSTTISWNGNPAHMVTIKDLSEMHLLKKTLASWKNPKEKSL